MVDRPLSDWDVTETMAKYGGGFVRALAACARRADEDNLAKLKAAFPEYWDEYATMARMVRAKRTYAADAAEEQ